MDDCLASHWVKSTDLKTDHCLEDGLEADLVQSWVQLMDFQMVSMTALERVHLMAAMKE